MLDLASVAKLEERRLVLGLEAVAPESCRMGSGILCRGAPGTWINTSSGFGIDGPCENDHLLRLIEWFEDAAIEPRVELCPFAHPSLVSALAERGFVPRDFENVLFRELRRGEIIAPVYDLPAEITVGLIDASSDEAAWSYARAVSEGFATQAHPAVDEDVSLWVRVIRHPSVKAFAACVGDRIVGGGAMEVHSQHSEVAALFGLSVLPPYRGRGIQSTLLAARLTEAAAAGATVATIGARPGVATERNARRLGFSVAYTKVILVRPGPGLRPND